MSEEQSEQDIISEFMETEIEFVERAPIAAVALRESLRSFAVICTDGAVFKMDFAGDWHEAEPVPGTARAASWEG